MTKKRALSPEEKAAFRDAMEGTKPLKQEKHKSARIQPKASHASRRAAAESHKESAETFFREEIIAPTEWLTSEDSLHFVRSGLQHKLIQRLRRGQVPIEARIDLHRQTINEAIKTLNDFIGQCVERNIRWVCIVHGKGHFSSTGKPVLKSFLNQWLREQATVLAFHSARPKEGGTGALYVLLKAKK